MLTLDTHTRKKGAFPENPLAFLRNHHDRATGTLFGANPATLAVVILEFVLARLNLLNSVIGANAETVITTETVATRHTAPRLK